jgi:hypothetical protein
LQRCRRGEDVGFCVAGKLSLYGTYGIAAKMRYRGSELDAVRVAPALRVEHPFSIPSAGLDESQCLDDERPDAVGNVTPVALDTRCGV